MAHDVFISYSQKDKAMADAICHHLESESIRCWMAPRDIPYGKDWSEAIIEGMESSRVMVFVFSANANESSQVKREVQCAFERGVMVIPFRVENVVPAKGLAYYLGSVHWLDALTPPLEKYLNDLSERLKKVLSSEELPLKTASPASTNVQAGGSGLRDGTRPNVPSKGEASFGNKPGQWMRIALGSMFLVAVVSICIFVFNAKSNKGKPARENVSPFADPVPAPTAQQAITEGLAAKNRGSLSEAIDRFSKAIELEPANTNAWACRAQARLIARDLSGAIADARKAELLDPASIDAMLTSAEAHLWLEDQEQAKACATRILKQNSRIGRAYAIRALAEDGDGIQDAERAVEFAPEDTLGLTAKAMEFVNANQVDEGVAVATKALRLNANFAPAHVCLALAFANQKNLDDALSEAREAAKLEPKISLPMVTLAKIYGDKQDFEQSEFYCNEAIRLNPNSSVAYAYRGIARMASDQDVAQALADFNGAIRLNPRSSIAYCGRALAKLKVGQEDEALADATEAIHLLPKNADAYAVRALVNAATGDEKGALKDADKAIALGCRDPELLKLRRKLVE